MKSITYLIPCRWKRYAAEAFFFFCNFSNKTPLPVGISPSGEKGVTERVWMPLCVLCVESIPFFHTLLYLNSCNAKPYWLCLSAILNLNKGVENLLKFYLWRMKKITTEKSLGNFDSLYGGVILRLFKSVPDKRAG